MRLVQNSFVGGEISPGLFGRHDLEAYFHAARRIENFTVMPTGGLRKRHGTHLMWHISGSGEVAYRAIPYFYDRTHAACILLYRKPDATAAYYRFCKTPGTAGAETAISTSVLTFANAAALADAQIKQVGDTIFITGLGRKTVKGAVNYSAGTVTWSQAADTPTPAMPGAMTLTPRGFNSDTEAGFVSARRTYGLIGVKDGVYSPIRKQSCQIYLYWVAGATVTIAFTPNWTAYDYYLLSVQQAGQWGILDEIYPADAPSSYSFVDDNISATSFAGVMEALNVGDNGFDCSVVDVWEQRLVYASSQNMPFTLWFSRAGDVNNFHTDRPQTQDGAFSVTIPTLVSSRILHMVTSRWFLLLTESGEYMVGSAGNSGFGFSTISIRRTSNVGAHEDIPPVVTENAVLFVAADGKTVYSLQYSLEEDSVTPVNVSMRAAHITESSRIRRAAFAKFPIPTLLCLLEDGTMAAMTYVPAEKIFAWSRYVFGGDLKCVDVMVPGSIREGAGLEGSSEVWLAFTHASKPGDIWIERMRVDSVGDVQGFHTATCADHCGYADSDFPVTGRPPQRNVEAHVVTVRPEIQDFNTIGLHKVIRDCVVRLNRSGMVTVRPDSDDFEGTSGAVQAGAEPIVSGEVTDNTDNRTVALVTKDVKILPRAFNNTDGRMVVSSTDRWPCEILSVLFNIEVAQQGRGGS